MNITSIVENTSVTDLPVEHGLSLYIELDNGRNLLFDMGQQRLFADNAKRLGLNIADVDIAIVSHGHYDHGGGLRTFLEINNKSNVYIHRDAFKPHYSLRDDGIAYIGLDKDMADNGRIVVCDSMKELGNEFDRISGTQLTLFADIHGDCCKPLGNKLLFGPSKTENDTFTHEQNLIIEEGDNVVLFAGCAHKGIVNIMRRATEVCGKVPTHILAGFHLVNRCTKTIESGLDESDEQTFINNLAQELMSFKATKFFTMHCTGTEQFHKLKTIMGNQITYLSCGDRVII